MNPFSLRGRSRPESSPGYPALIRRGRGGVGRSDRGGHAFESLVPLNQSCFRTPDPPEAENG